MYNHDNNFLDNLNMQTPQIKQQQYFQFPQVEPTTYNTNYHNSQPSQRYGMTNNQYNKEFSTVNSAKTSCSFNPDVVNDQQIEQIKQIFKEEAKKRISSMRDQSHFRNKVKVDQKVLKKFVDDISKDFNLQKYEQILDKKMEDLLYAFERDLKAKYFYKSS